MQGLNIKVHGFVFTNVSAALSPSRKVNLGSGALRAHQHRFRLPCRKSQCHARFQEVILHNVWFPKCSVQAPTRAAACGKVADYVNKLGTCLYLLSLVIWLSRGPGEAKRGSTSHSEFLCTLAGTDGL